MAVKRTRGAPTPIRGSKLTIGFGPVNVALKLAPLVKSDSGRIAGRMLCPTHLEPIKQASYCAACDGNVETVTGYEVDGRFVVIDKATLGLSSDQRLELNAVVDVGAIDPVYFEKAYLLWPQEGYEQGFDLIAAVLRATGKAAIGTTVMSNATRVLVLRWSDAMSCLVAHTCVYDSRLAWTDVELVRHGADAREALPEQMLVLAEQLLGSLEADGYAFAEVADEYDLELREAIELAASGLPPSAKKAAAAPAQVLDLMEALKASVAKAAAGEKPKPKRKAAA